MIMNDNTKLYRIVSFASFINLIELKKERYVLPSTWDDSYEGFLLNTLNSEQYRKRTLKFIYEELSKRNTIDFLNKAVRILLSYNACYCQCWSLEKDSDSLWRANSNNNSAVQITTNYKRLNELLQKNKKNFAASNTFIDKVKYLPVSKDEFNCLCDVLKKSLDAKSMFFYKRKTFNYEKEIRAMILLNLPTKLEIVSLVQAIFKKNPDVDKVDSFEKAYMIFEDFYDTDYNKHNKAIKKDSSLLIEAENIKDYIINVRVHPKAKGYIVDTVEAICKRVGIKFGGKSDLYKKI